MTVPQLSAGRYTATANASRSRIILLPCELHHVSRAFGQRSLCSCRTDPCSVIAAKWSAGLRRSSRLLAWDRLSWQQPWSTSYASWTSRGPHRLLQGAVILSRATIGAACVHLAVRPRRLTSPPFPSYSAGIGVAGAVGVVAACDGADGPLSGRSSIEIRNAMPNERTSTQARNTKRKA